MTIGAISFLLLPLIPAGAAPLPQDDRLDRDTCRVQVQAVVRPRPHFAAYRVRIWTHGKQRVLFHHAHGVTTAGYSAAEPDVAGHRADILVTVGLDPVPGRPKDLAVEYRIVFGGDTGGDTQAGDTVPVGTTLEAVIRVREGQHVQKLGERRAVGQLLGRPLHLEVK